MLLASFVDTFLHVGWVIVQLLTYWAVGTYLVFGVIMVLFPGVLLLPLIMEKLVVVFFGVDIQQQQKTMLILGSGGHTQELLNLVPYLSALYPRLYIKANSDRISAKKARQLEETLNAGNEERVVKYRQTYRIREVGQSWITVVFFAGPLAFCHAAMVMLKHRPTTIICNGPGLCVPFCLIGFVLTKLRLLKTRIVFVESICRVDTLSMTGKMLIHLADDFFVQWHVLKIKCSKKYPKANVQYLGRLT
ncbi:UDP-N-acetylglucosamine transferase subunit ALG14 [Orchesella cincta]|uniref:UDP-N-acetylglucosamine transferase subunit ALG14 n=1 Tax=Orchesella cincta TaxID=48709 RepID=A0A1D2N4I1_ORCCI|nr:UDP-N-acetylglucosamine transferase subunit ALG14 [Orchesella cincta]